LGASLSSVVLGLVVETVFVYDSVGEDLNVTCDAHDESSEVEVLRGVGLSPHAVKEIPDLGVVVTELLKSIVESCAILILTTVMHNLDGLDLFMRLRYNCHVDKDESSFVLTTVKLSYEVNVAKIIIKVGHKIFIVVLNYIGVLVVHKLPVVEGISITIFQQGLAIPNSLGKLNHRNCKLCWKDILASSVGVVCTPSMMARFEHIACGGERVVSEECCVESSIVDVHLADLLSEVREVTLDGLSELILCE